MNNNINIVARLQLQVIMMQHESKFRNSAYRFVHIERLNGTVGITSICLN